MGRKNTITKLITVLQVTAGRSGHAINKHLLFVKKKSFRCQCLIKLMIQHSNPCLKCWKEGLYVVLLFQAKLS